MSRKRKLKEGSKKEEAMDKMMRKPKLGSGARFQQLKGKLGGAKNPGALAAWIGRKKFGNKKMAQLSAHGKKGRIPQKDLMKAESATANPNLRKRGAQPNIAGKGGTTPIQKLLQGMQGK